MELHEIRQKNLEWLCQKYGRDVVATRCGYQDKGYLGVLLSKGENKTKIGNKTAKKIEEAFPELPFEKGWLNTPHWPPSSEEETVRLEAARISELYLQMGESERVLARRLFGIVEESDKPPLD